VIRKIENEYKDDVALLLAVHGHNTDDDQHGICFDYFVPATDRGNELAVTFIIDGVGYDLYPRSWERLENSVEMNDMPIVLAGAEILYARSKEDEERFMNLKKRLNDNLQKPEFVYGKALEYMDNALEIYRSIIFEDKSYRVKSEAGCIHLYLSKAVAVLNHSFTEEPIMTEKQAFNVNPDSRIYHCPEMKEVPEGFFKNAESLLRENDPEKIKEIVLKLLKSTREFILARQPKTSPQKLSEADYDQFAEWYQELSLTWRRIRFFEKNNMVEEAYCDAGYLQQELFYIAQEFGVEEMNLIDSFDPDDLSKLRKQADILEKKVLEKLADHKTEVKSYDSVDAFLKSKE
jgi:tetratricopeptide (TPR) repeat protein